MIGIERSIMKRILIYDVAAVSGGAKTILDQFYEQYRNQKNVQCYFIVSLLDYEENDFVHVIKLPWVKKSWLHRLYCDYIYMPKLIKSLEIDEVLSLQNIGIPGCPCFQSVYVHNAIPFSDVSFKLVEDPFLWIYQNVIGRLTYRSLKKVDSIIVQTDWMRDRISEKCDISKSHIEVRRVFEPDIGSINRIESEEVSFFYPCTAVKFKNIDVIIQACMLLDTKLYDQFKVYLTIGKDDNELSRKYFETIVSDDLPIYFIGHLSNDKMSEYYSKSILIFPSYLETVGLPILEAQEYSSSIIVSDCLYAHDSVGNYENVEYFNYDKPNELSELMKSHICTV